ncbi:hypothetical protein DFQ27_003586 [Actinomortierella ambigua]|uniref:Ricin B lectin domain-containing protein n=1 Tax=Actinomortierella ambigua TaxID=1343610 RepID=A0A9P6Q4C0_9FUNG|nr:hypothetical protein DFQ27_003586 [Actinomortierella ambigua]
MIPGNDIGCAKIVPGDGQMYYAEQVVINDIPSNVREVFSVAPYGDGFKIRSEGSQRWLMDYKNDVWAVDNVDPKLSKWYFEPNDDGSYTIKNPRGLVMTAMEGGDREYNYPYMMSPNGSTNQKWTLEACSPVFPTPA